MLLAAGLGSRMRPLTLKVPKPLVKVAGLALIDRAMVALEKINISKVVVNLHHLGMQIKTYLERPESRRSFQFIFSDERAQLLDSGGAIVKALPLLGNKPFFVLNSDTFWQEEISNLERLAAAFDPAIMDILLLTVRPEQMVLTERGDFVLENFPKSGNQFLDKKCGGNSKRELLTLPSDVKTALCAPYHDQVARLRRATAHDPQAVTYSGALIVRPEIFINAKVIPHSLNVYFDQAIAAGRLYGLPLQGRWYTVGTMDAIAAVSAILAG